MIALLLSTSISLFLFLTFGIYFTKVMKIPSTFVESLLIGLVVCNTITTTISLFLPINIFVLLTLISLSLFIFFFITKELQIYFSSLSTNIYIVFFSCLFISIAILISLGTPTNYDSGLYHIQSIKWIGEYSVVPGLANLHGRFGFNPNIFTFFALTSFYDLFKQEIFSVNLAVFAILVFYFIKKTYSIFKQPKLYFVESANLFLFYIFLFLIILKLLHLSSPSPDFLATTITLFIFARLLDISSQKVNFEFKIYIPILILSVYISTVKLATFPILLLFIFIFIKHKSELQKSFWLLPLFCSILAPWLIRNLILTGWLIYPFPSIDLFNFDWKVPLENVILEKQSITGWARHHGDLVINAENMNLWDWFPKWWQREHFYVRIFFVLSIIFPFLIITHQLIKKTKIDFITNAVISTSFLGVLFWFFLAPDWRFGESFILIASMSPLLVLKSHSMLKFNAKFVFTIILILLLTCYTIGKFVTVIILISSFLFFKPFLITKYNTKIIFGILLIILLGIYIIRNSNEIKTNSHKILYSNCLITPCKIQTPSDVNFRTYKISGTKINVPSEGDRCYDCNIPCTPYPDSSLVLRNNTLEYGFKHIIKEN